MIIKCLAIYDSHKKEITNKPFSGFITVNRLYQALEIDVGTTGIKYRIIQDGGKVFDHPILVRANEFEVVSGKIPPNWEMVRNGENYFTFGPERWIKDEYWQDSFWEDWDNGSDAAIECYKEELKIIFDSDPLEDGPFQL